jgi:DNA-binding CsgD family transcriptional regulator
MSKPRARESTSPAADRQRRLERARALYGERAWREAYDALAQLDGETPLAAEDLERLGVSAGLTARTEELLKALERQHHAELEAGHGLRAARAAFWLAHRLLAMGEAGRSSAWLSRAQRLVDAADCDCVERGYLHAASAVRKVIAGEFDVARIEAAQAVEIGRRFGDADLVALARNFQGRALMRQGLVEDGLALLDENMLAVVRGEVTPLVGGLVYCGMIAGCHQVYALERAREWTAALADFCAAQPQLVMFTGICSVHRAELLQLEGAWPRAIEEARKALAPVGGMIDPGPGGEALYQEAEILRLRGEFDAAEASYRAASERGREPQPGLSLLRLAQGRSEPAASAIRRVVSATGDALQRTRYLPACVEIMLAAGELVEARAACEELECVAGSFESEVLSAMAAHARGALRLAEADASGALEPLRRSFQSWQRIGAPYIAARIRVLLGRACRALGDEDGARLELDAAAQVFRELGAAPDLAALAIPAQGATHSARPSHGLTARELQVLRLVASGKTNKLIARELFVSEKTVDRHVSNIFVKLNVTSRAAATAFAYEHKLL